MKYTKQTQTQTRRWTQTPSGDSDVNKIVIYQIKLVLYYIYHFVLKHNFSII